MVDSTQKDLRFLAQTIVSISTVGIASAALFLLGFYVIPVFADKAPQMFSQQDADTSFVIDDNHKKKSLQLLSQ